MNDIEVSVDGVRFARQAVSLAGKERLYDRAVAAEAWVIKLQERIIERDEYISALENDLATSRGALRNARKRLKRLEAAARAASQADKETPAS